MDTVFKYNFIQVDRIDPILLQCLVGPPSDKQFFENILHFYEFGAALTPCNYLSVPISMIFLVMSSFPIRKSYTISTRTCAISPITK